MTKLATPTKRVVVFLLFALVVHVFVIPQIGGAREALSVLGSVSPLLLGLAVVLEVAALLADARLVQLLIPNMHRPSLGISFGAVVASTGVNHVVPGGAAGAAANYRLLGRSGVPADELGFALGTQAISSAVVLNVILWFALVASIPASGFHPIYATAAAVGAVLMGAFAAVVIGLRRGREAVADRVAAAVGRLPKIDPMVVRATLISLTRQLDSLADDRRRLVLVLGYAAVSILLDGGALYVAMVAFGPRPAVVGLFVAYGLATVIGLIPVSPGGLGVIEAILIPTLVGFGSPRSQTAIAVVVYRLVNFWMPIPVGAISYVVISRHNHQGREGFIDETNRQISPSPPSD